MILTCKIFSVKDTVKDTVKDRDHGVSMKGVWSRYEGSMEQV